MKIHRADVPDIDELLKTAQGRYFLCVSGGARYCNLTADEMILLLLEALTSGEFTPAQMKIGTAPGWTNRWLKS